MTLDNVPTAATGRVAEIAMRYIESYNAKDFVALERLLDPEHFQFSHLSQGAAAGSRGEFVAILKAMAADTFPDRRFVDVRSLQVIEDVVVIDSIWKATPIVSAAGRFSKGVAMTLRLKSFIVVKGGVIVEIRDHDTPPANDAASLA